ncbi:acyltransferase [Bowmanella denitrificans]|uniref:Acyltransferase n=1 Tax=Bowmanella denitrificans TaxID=366582 RepID=A0ABN0XLT1_9ALTE
MKDSPTRFGLSGQAAESLPALTALRGIAALLVVAFHFDIFIARLLPGGLTPASGKLYLMVDLFFVLSGFIMCHVYGHQFSQGWCKQTFRRFILARFARIYPLHLFSLVLVIGLWALMYLTDSFNRMFELTYDISALPAHLLLLQAAGTHNEATWNSPSWSISVEWMVYFLFPWLALLLAKGNKATPWLLLLFCAAGYLAIMFYFQPAYWARRWDLLGIPVEYPYPTGTIDVLTGSAILRCLCGFILGMLCHRVYMLGMAAKWATRRFLPWLIILVLVAGWHGQWLIDPLAVVLFTGLILCLANSPKGNGKGLERPVWQWLGDISYSMYLLHMPMIFAFIGVRRALYQPDPLALPMGYDLTLWQSWGLLALMFVLLCLFSTLSYRYIENPARYWLKRRFSQSGVTQGPFLVMK